MLPCSSSNRSVLRHRLAAIRPSAFVLRQPPVHRGLPPVVSSSRNEVPTPSVVTLLSLTNPSASRVRGPLSMPATLSRRAVFRSVGRPFGCERGGRKRGRRSAEASG
jgi:hypothetical protein